MAEADEWADMSLAELSREIYRHHPCGCCWHIVLDDGNVRASDVAFCRKWAAEHECLLCVYFGTRVGGLHGAALNEALGVELQD